LTFEPVDTVELSCGSRRQSGHARRNVAALLELSNNDGPERLDGRNIDFRHATLPLFYVVTIIGIAGLWLHGRDWRVRLLAVLAAEFAALMILILAPPRLRAPIDVICCIGVGLAVASLRSRHRERHRPDPDRVPVAAQNVSLAATRVPPPDHPDGAFAVAVT
jgi:hypothetical protein